MRNSGFTDRRVPLHSVIDGLCGLGWIADRLEVIVYSSLGHHQNFDSLGPLNPSSRLAWTPPSLWIVPLASWKVSLDIPKSLNYSSGLSCAHKGDFLLAWTLQSCLFSRMLSVIGQHDFFVVDKRNTIAFNFQWILLFLNIYVAISIDCASVLFSLTSFFEIWNFSEICLHVFC